MFRPGQVIGGRYEVVALVGERALAAVFRAKDRTTGREIAIKCVRSNFITKVGAQVMQREARAVASVGQSPSIVEALDIGYDDALATPYVVMPLLSGETMQQRIARAGAIPAEEIQKYAAQLGFALDKAHAVGVVHAALSPTKLFLTRDARQDPLLKVLDFGVGKVLDNHPQAAQQITHAAYTAPEQLSAEAKRLARSYGARVADAVTPATDVWAIGLICFEALIGAPPGTFWGIKQAQEVGLKIVQRPPIPSQIAGANAGMLPQGFDDWFKRCVHLEPMKRFQRASEACNELVTLLDQLVPKPSTNLGGAVRTFLVGGADPAAAKSNPTPPVASGRAYVPTPAPISPAREPSAPGFAPPARQPSAPGFSPAAFSPAAPAVAFSPTPGPAAPPQRPAPRVLETALAIPDHEVSRVPPAPSPRASGGAVAEPVAQPPRSNTLVIALVAVGLVLVVVVAVLVIVLAKK